MLKCWRKLRESWSTLVRPEDEKSTSVARPLFYGAQSLNISHKLSRVSLCRHLPRSLQICTTVILADNVSIPPHSCHQPVHTPPHLIVLPLPSPQAPGCLNSHKILPMWTVLAQTALQYRALAFPFAYSASFTNASPRLFRTTQEALPGGPYSFSL